MLVSPKKNGPNIPNRPLEPMCRNRISGTLVDSCSTSALELPGSESPGSLNAPNRPRAYLGPSSIGFSCWGEKGGENKGKAKKRGGGRGGRSTGFSRTKNSTGLISGSHAPPIRMQDSLKPKGRTENTLGIEHLGLGPFPNKPPIRSSNKPPMNKVPIRFSVSTFFISTPDRSAHATLRLFGEPKQCPPGHAAA